MQESGAKLTIASILKNCDLFRQKHANKPHSSHWCTVCRVYSLPGFAQFIANSDQYRDRHFSYRRYLDVFWFQSSRSDARNQQLTSNSEPIHQRSEENTRLVSNPDLQSGVADYFSQNLKLKLPGRRRKRRVVFLTWRLFDFSPETSASSVCSRSSCGS